MKFHVTPSLYQEMIEKSSLTNIVDHGRAIALIPYANDFYVTCGGVFGKYINAYKAIDLRVYQGEKQPLEYSEHFDEVAAGTRERTYCGLKIKYQDNWIVLTGPKVEFYPKPEDEQLQLF